MPLIVRCMGTFPRSARPANTRRPGVALALTALLLAGITTAPSPSAYAEAGSEVRTVTYLSGRTMTRADQVDRKLRETSAPFRTFVERRVAYVTSHDCQELGEVTVYRWRSDGWAVAHEYYGCGGNDAIYVRTGTGWRAPAALGSQEPLACRTLRQWEVPPALLHRVPPRQEPYLCYTADGRLVRYR